MRKSMILGLTCVIAAVLLVLVGAYLTGAVHEKSSSDREKKNSQAVNLADAGLNQGIAELKERILIDLNTAIKTKTSTHMKTYAGSSASKNSLDFLHDSLPAYFSAPNAQGESTAVIAPIALTTNISDASRTITLILRKQKDEAGNDKEAYQEGSDTYKFPYEFAVTASGSVSGIGKTFRLLQGKFEATIHRQNFARFALFTNHHTSPAGEAVWFTEKTRFYGPVHTNDQFRFANNPSAYFGDEVTQHLSKAYFYNQGWPRQLDSDYNGAYDVPTFSQGFTRGEDVLNLESSITTNDLRDKVGYTSSGGSGIYIPLDGTTVAGGIYIKGNNGQPRDNASVALSTSGNSAVYTIQQNTLTSRGAVNGSVTKIITVDFTASTTHVATITRDSSGVITSSTEFTYQGKPDGTEHKGIIIYSDDDIGCESSDGCSNAGVSGTVAKASQVTISSERNIVISDNLMYEEYSTTPSLNATAYTNLLGLLSWGGDVIIGTSAPNDLDIHAVIMAVHGAFTVDNYRTRSPSGDVNLLGGVISDTYGAFGTFSGTTQVSGYGRNFIYDTRMLYDMSPPYYPTTTDFCISAPALDKKIGDMSLIWQQE
ncbi:MAG: DUF4900 domain-containing protein [Candidatus Omnitrophica bacterium]|nr:DUF4900 domain-containing protein [Candidatus Omnitrophota bacterium]